MNHDKVPINAELCVLYAQKNEKDAPLFGKVHPWDGGKKF